MGADHLSGNEKRGAAAAVLDIVENSATFPGYIANMVQSIVPAVREQLGDLLDNGCVRTCGTSSKTFSLTC